MEDNLSNSKTQTGTFSGNTCCQMMHHDALNSSICAAVLIGAGFVFLIAGKLGYSDEQGWSLFFPGAAVLVLLEVIVRLRFPAYRKGLFGSLVCAGILLGLGTGSWTYVLPFILIAVGISIIRSARVKSQRLE